MNMIESKTFNRVATVLLTLLVILAILPIILIIMGSVTDESTLIRSGYSFLPTQFSLASYYYMIKQGAVIGRAYLLSMFVTLVGTVLSVIITTSLAYPIARSSFKYKNQLAFFVFFTMLFNGGIVPSYIMWTQLFHIKDTVFALMIPNYLVTGFNVILVKNYYQNNVPPALIEAAKIDGATELEIYTKVMFPLSRPIIATISLFTGLAYWNDWTNGLYYIDNSKLYTIQLLLIKIMNNIQALKTNSAAATALQGASMDLPGTSVRMAMAFIGIIPILIVYPFVQKYLVEGIVVGAVKG